MQQLDIPLVYQSYEFYKELNKLRKSVPKTDRYTIWLKCENTTLEILELLLKASYLEPMLRLETAKQTSVYVDKLKILIRLCFETNVISKKCYISLQAKLDEIGRMLGGWIKSLKTLK
jgi:hypothetical protein